MSTRNETTRAVVEHIEALAAGRETRRHRSAGAQRSRVQSSFSATLRGPVSLFRRANRSAQQPRGSALRHFGRTDPFGKSEMITKVIPKGSTLRFPLHRLPADIAPAEALRPSDLVDRRIGARLRLRHSAPQPAHIEHAPAVG